MSVDPDEWSLIQSTLLSLSGEILIYLLIFLILLFLSACFSAIETAFSSLNIIRVRQQSRGNRKNAKAAKKVLKIHKNFSRFLSTVLVANNLVNIGASSLVTYVLSVSFQLAETGVLIATLGVSLMVITFGEIIPKNFAALYPEKIAYWVAGPVLLLTKIMHPITFGFQKMNQKIVERAEDEEDRVTATEEELIEIVETIEREGVLEQIESEIIQSAIDFDDKTVRVAMIEKDKVVYVRENISFLDLLQAVRSSPYSRIPVLAENEDKVVGIIRQRDLFDRVVAYNGVPDLPLNSLYRVPNYVSYRRPLPYALEKMQRQKNHMLIVVDNVREKNFLGILTLEDVLEEIVGEIYDESDKLPTDVVEIGHHIFEVKGSMEIEEFFDRFLDDTVFPRTTATTIGEWVKRLTRRKWKEGKIVRYDNLVIKITHCDENSIDKVEIEQQTKMDDEDDD